MDFNTYNEKVSQKFEKMISEEIEEFTCNIAYEEIFKWEWLATKLKIFSIISFKESIDKETILSYNTHCYGYSKRNYKRLGKGLQNGFVSFAILATENIDKSAIEFIETGLSKHYSAFEFPILIDLKNEKIIYNSKNPMWGSMYYSFFKGYIEEKFGFS